MSFLALIARNRLALGGLIVMAVVILLALLNPLLPLAEPNITDTSNRFVRPFSEGAPLGTDHLGRDLLSRLMWGTRLSLAVGFAAALVAALFVVLEEVQRPLLQRVRRLDLLVLARVAPVRAGRHAERAERVRDLGRHVRQPPGLEVGHGEAAAAHHRPRSDDPELENEN